MLKLGALGGLWCLLCHHGRADGHSWAQFARTDDPNRSGLPHWPRQTAGNILMWFGEDGAQTRSDPAVSRFDLLGRIFQTPLQTW